MLISQYLSGRSVRTKASSLSPLDILYSVRGEEVVCWLFWLEAFFPMHNHRSHHTITRNYGVAKCSWSFLAKFLASYLVGHNTSMDVAFVKVTHHSPPRLYWLLERDARTVLGG